MRLQSREDTVIADLPRIYATPNIPFSGPMARTTPDDFGAGVWGTLARVTEGMRQKQLPIEAAQMESQYNIAVNDLKNKVMAENADPLTWRSTFQAEEAALRKQMSDGIQDKEIQSVFNFQSARSYDNHIIDISTAGIKASHNRQQIGVKAELKDIAIQYGGAQTNKEQAELMAKASGLLLSASTPLDAGGQPIPSTYTREEAVAMHQEFLRDADKERVSWMAERTPAQLIEALKDPKQFPTLDASARNTARGRAQESMNLMRIGAERAEQQRIDNLNRDIIVASAADNVNLFALRETVFKNAGALDFKSLNHWKTVFDSAIKAQQSGEDSPFFKSQGDVLAHVMKGVLEAPEKWSTTDITQYIGRGLSAKDAESIEGLRERRLKEGGDGRMTPMAQARSSWDEQRKMGAFLNAEELVIFRNKDKDQIGQAAMVAENDRRAQAVLDRMVLAEKNKIDPRKALQTEMQPFYNETVTTWGQRWMPFSGVGMFEYTRPKTPQEIRDAQGRAFTGQDPTKPGPPGPGAKTLTVPDLAVLVPKVKQFFKSTFNKELPVSAQGQSGTHDKLKFDHTRSMDVSLSPTTKEGQVLMAWLDTQGIPFIAYDRAVPGQSTGPHIHIGNPSPRAR